MKERSDIFVIVGAAAALAVAMGGTALLLLGGSSTKTVIRVPAPPAAPVPAAAGRGPVAAPGTSAEDRKVVSREEAATGTIEGGEALTRDLAAALTPHVGREAAVRGAVKDAREGKIDAVDLETKLRATLDGDPRAGGPVLEELLAERRPDLALKLAQTLATLLDDATLRNAAVDALAKAPPEARATGLLALLGRGEPEPLALAARSFASDASDARATAGFLLNNAPDGRTGPAPAEAIEAARAALRDPPGTSARIREEALGILGRPGAADADLGLIERTLLEGPEPTVRARALDALVNTGVARGRIRPVLERALGDPATPAELKEMIKAYLAQQG